MKDFMRKHIKKAVAAGASVYASVASAAPVALPATAEADLTGSVNNGGNLLLTVAVLVVGFVIVARLIKKN